MSVLSSEKLRINIEPYEEGYLVTCRNTSDQVYGKTKTEAILNLCVLLANLHYYCRFEDYILVDSDLPSL